MKIKQHETERDGGPRPIADPEEALCSVQEWPLRLLKGRHWKEKSRQFTLWGRSLQVALNLLDVFP